MRTLLQPLALALFLGASLSAAQTIPKAVIADPAPDKAHPAEMQVAAIQCHGAKMNGVLYIAAGAGPHPTLLFLHGLPGNEQNLDLAQAVRRAGWNVLTMHYRGSWGSEGAFSFTNAAEDSLAALAWLHDPANATRARIDTTRLAVAGHSLGGFLAAYAGANDPQLIGVAMISPWNLGAEAARFKVRGDKGRAAFVQGMSESMESLSGCTPESMTDDAFAHAEAWNFRGYAETLARRPLLLISSQDGNGPEASALAAAARKAGAKAVEELTMETDHSYSDHRIALQAAVVVWLEGLAAKQR
ncbi:MAG: alpha/beta hydrolase [Planctomycetes bacterium]|nr:alpha/beta hydrolase [Planctomycetota bacterium]